MASSLNMQHGPSCLGLITVVLTPTAPSAAASFQDRPDLSGPRSGRGGMTSATVASRTVMKDTDSKLPTAVCVSPADNLALSGDRPVASPRAASHGSGLQCHTLLNMGFGYAQKRLCIAAKKNRESVVINQCQ